MRTIYHTIDEALQAIKTDFQIGWIRIPLSDSVSIDIHGQPAIYSSSQHQILRHWSISLVAEDDYICVFPPPGYGTMWPTKQLQTILYSVAATSERFSQVARRPGRSCVHVRGVKPDSRSQPTYTGVTDNA